MSLFDRADQEPSEAFAAEEQHRADGLAATIADIQNHPDSARAKSLPHYRAAYRDAAGNAAHHTAQPQQ